MDRFSPEVIWKTLDIPIYSSEQSVAYFENICKSSKKQHFDSRFYKEAEKVLKMLVTSCPSAQTGRVLLKSDTLMWIMATSNLEISLHELIKRSIYDSVIKNAKNKYESRLSLSYHQDS